MLPIEAKDFLQRILLLFAESGFIVIQHEFEYGQRIIDAVIQQAQPAQQDAGIHMPRRRTEGVVHPAGRPGIVIQVIVVPGNLIVQLRLTIPLIDEFCQRVDCLGIVHVCLKARQFLFQLLNLLLSLFLLCLLRFLVKFPACFSHDYSSICFCSDLLLYLFQIS